MARWSSLWWLSLLSWYSHSFLLHVVPTNHHRPSRHSSRLVVLTSNPSSSSSSSCDDDDDDKDPYLPLWKLASAHCASQALHTVIELKIPQFLYHKKWATVDEIASYIAVGPTKATTNTTNHNKNGQQSRQLDALVRLLRLLTTVNILQEEEIVVMEEKEENNHSSSTTTIRFSLTKTGQLLINHEESSSSDDGDQEELTTTITTSGMASGIQHWMEEPLWSSWLEVPNYLRGQEGKNPLLLPFERANDGISSDSYYNEKDHPKSLQKANKFVRWVHDQEIGAILNGFDWSTLNGKQLVDIGGHYGTVLAAIMKQHPTIHCISLDLPEVIDSAPVAPLLLDSCTKTRKKKKKDGVTLVGGNVMDVSTIPKNCDAILLKHFLDRCMWTEEETIQLLLNCKSALCCEEEGGGTIIIAEAVLPNVGSSSFDDDHHHHPTALYMDALYMLVGREGQRTEAEWRTLVDKAGFYVESITTTSIPTCSILILKEL